MPTNLAQPKIKVVAVDPSGPVRQMMADTLRSVMSFDAVEARATVQDALQILESEAADWLLLPLMADQPINALHVLKICTENPSLRHVRISLFLGEDEAYVVPKAFELGCISYHHRPFTKDTLTSEIRNFFAVLDSLKANEPLAAAHYLRHYLKTAKDYQSQAELEKALLDVFPGDPQTLLHLAEPQFHLGQEQLARKTLSQVKLLDEKLTDKANDVAKSLFGDKADPAGEGGNEAFNAIGLKNVCIIDSDETSAKAVEDILKNLGCPNIVRFADGQSAWQHLEKNPEPDLIISEWRVPKLTGPLIIQRIRHHGFFNVPIVILSSLLKNEDMPLVKEIGVAEIILKPLKKDSFIPALIWIMRQERLPTEQLSIERKIRMLLKSGKKAEAEPLRVQLLADKMTPMSRKRLIEAEFAFAGGQYELAREAGVEALKLTGDSIHVLNVLGKTFMRLSNFEAALKCFKKAQDMSPHNIERLCLIAETQTELGNEEAAKETLAEASATDAGAVAVTEAKVKVAITQGDSAAAKKMMSAFESIDGIIAYMNNKAVALARCNQNQEAIELYKKTSESVPEEQVDAKAIVLYNLALANVRNGDFADALKYLEDVLKIPNTRVAKKATSLIERLKKAQQTGAEFRLRSTDSSAPKSAAAPTAVAGPNPMASSTIDHELTPEPEAKLNTEDDYKRMLASVDVKRGEFCCFMIFANQAAPDVRVTSLLAKTPSFKPRVAIERQEAAVNIDHAKG